jgi:phosphate transport system substrate-binding protein
VSKGRDKPIVRFGLERGRGAHELLREVVLEGSEFAADIGVEPVSTSVVQGVATQAGGIGYPSGTTGGAEVVFEAGRSRITQLGVVAAAHTRM